MAAVSEIRERARAAIFAAGGRGFVRFLPEGEEALLVSDAVRRCENTKALTEACRAAGFRTEEREGLLRLTPTEETLRAMGAPVDFAVDWAAPDAADRAFAARLMRSEAKPMTEAGRRLAVETLRLIWQDDAHVHKGLSALRARAATCLRTHDDSGFFVCGALLARRLAETETV